MTKYIGAHVSASGGVGNAILNAEAIGATAFALFTRNQRSWVSKPLAQGDIDGFKALLAERGFDPRYVLPHDSYLINLGSPDEETLLKSRAAFLKHKHRLMLLDINPHVLVHACGESIAVRLRHLTAAHPRQGCKVHNEHEQTSHDGIVLLVFQSSQPTDFLRPACGVGCLQDDGHIVETGVVHKTHKEVPPQHA